MHIRNNSTNGSQPNQNNKSAAKSSTTQGAESVLPTSNDSNPEGEPTKTIRDARPKGDSFHLSDPKQDAGVDVSERLKAARGQAHDKRIAAARVKDSRQGADGQPPVANLTDSSEPITSRVENARMKDTNEKHMHRIANARLDNTESQQKADRISAARADALDRTNNVRGSDSVKRSGSVGNVSADSVQLSQASQNVSQAEVMDSTGVRETTDDRKVRIETLQKEHNQGILNSMDRTR
ncbi:MAG: hypothetical protein ACI8X5_003910, partial [Planctomycetota bacterium]